MAHAKALYERDGSHRLFKDGGELVLEVLVGTVAQYAVRLVLNATELADYSNRGNASIDQLAEYVARDEPSFRAGGRTKPV
jgi:hypothetical protein